MNWYLFISILLTIIFFTSWIVNRFKLNKNSRDLKELIEKFEAKEMDWERLNKASQDLNNQLKLLDSEKNQIMKEKEESKEKSRKMWAMNEAVYKEKKRVDEELEKLNEEKLKLEQAKAKLDEKVKKLWQTSTAVHKEKERINTLKQEIEQKHQEILDSVSYAQRIQQAILPAYKTLNELLPPHFVLYKPRDIVSGDFYWLAKSGGDVLLAVCDCTGHGVPGAFMSMIGNTLLNQIVNEKKITEPNLILNELNHEITKSLKQDFEDSDSRDGMDLALIKINENRSELHYAGANRPLYFIRDNELTETKADKMSIGGHIELEEKRFTNHVIKTLPGDVIYLSSDGFADQFSPQDKKLMTKRFKEVILSIQSQSMKEQGEFLNEYLSNWKGAMEQTDDVLVIGVKI